MNFRNFVIFFPWKRRNSSFEQTWIPYTRMICGKFGWNWTSGSGKDDFPSNMLLYFYNFAMLPWKYNGPLIRINMNSLHSSMIYAKFGWNWPSGPAEDFKNLSMYFRNFVIISPLKRAEPFIKTNLNPLYPRMLCVNASLFELAQRFWIRISKCEKLTDGQTARQVIRKAQLSFELRWAKKRCGPLFWTDLDVLSQRMLCGNLRWNCPNGSERRF